MEDEDLAEIMAEPPAGHNHGWTRNQHGGWSGLETGESLSRERPFVARDYHGRAYGYVKMKCRCVLCRAWKATYNTEYRSRKSNPLDEGNQPVGS